VVRGIGAALLNELDEYRDPGADEDPPVTAVASRRVKPNREGEFEEWTSGILSAARGFPGYLGSNVVRPNSSEDDEYQIVFKFDHASTLKRWEESEEHRHWLHKSEDLIKEEPDIRILTGLETWFTLPSREGDPPPPRYKMAIVTWLAVFPLATTVFVVLDPLIGGVHAILRTLVFTLIMVSLMTYVVMPRMTRLFSFWLYPKRKSK
jgi:antibiotic biosynthesis monooxygenase (ABM) superfamily enzyme